MSEILPLDPDNLTPSASLNRLPIVDVPGIKIDPHVRGKTGYDLLSFPPACFRSPTPA